MRRLLCPALLVLLTLAGCRSQRTALRGIPLDAKADAPTAEYSIQIPEGYDVRSVGFGTASLTSVSGGLIPQLPVSGSTQLQPYVHVYAVEQQTRREVLLIYGDLELRQEPVAVIRLEQGKPLRVARQSTAGAE